MKNLKFKRHNIGDLFDPTTAEKDTIHLVPISTEPLVVKMYDVDEYGNIAEISFDGWKENKDIIVKELENFKDIITLKYNDNDETAVTDIINRVDTNTGENVNYRETRTWHDGSTMDDSKVDGLIFIKKNEKFYANIDRIENKRVYITDFQGNDDAEKIENSIKFLKSNLGGTLVINRNLNLNRDLYLTNIYNITIEGLRDSDSTRSEFASTINLLEGANSIIFEKFNKLKIKNLKIVDQKGVRDNINTLEFFNGYDINIDNISIRTNSGINSKAISLGRGTGETCVFLGQISNISTYQENGGEAIRSNETNTSLTFSKCYARGGSFTMNGTVYSSMINCATDGSKTNGYLFKGSANSYLNSFSLVSCGAETAQLSAIKVESGVVGLSVIGGFHAGANKRIVDTDSSYKSRIGSLITTEVTDINHPIQSILIENPTIILPNGLDVYGGIYTGDITIVSNYRFLGDVGGDLEFIKNNYTLISSKSEIPNVTIKNKLVKKFDFFKIENHLVSASSNLSGNLVYLYPRINGTTITNGVVNRVVMNIPEGYVVTTEGFETTETMVNGLNILNKKVVGELAFLVNGSDMSGKIEIGVDVEKFSL